MRILLVSEDVPYPSLGGLAKHVMTLARALVKAGHEVDLLGGTQNPIEVAGEEGQFGGRFFGELHWHLAGWKEKKIGTFLPPKRLWIAKKMAKCIMAHAADYDVTHYHGHYPNIAKYIPQHINFVQTRHDQGSDCLIHTRFRDGEMCTRLDPSDCANCIAMRPNSLQRAVSKIAVRQYRLDVADAFRRHKTIFVSDMLRRNFSRIAGFGEWGTVVHNFIDIEKFRRILAANQQNHAIGDGRLTVFVAGMLYPPKGIGMLMEALVPVMPDHMRLIVAGNGPDETQLRALYESDRVKFLGWCNYPTVLKYTITSDIIIVPSVWEEAFGSTTLEGLLLGKPTFALNRGATPELKEYQQYQDQLHLHADMKSLVTELVDFQPKTFSLPELDGHGGVDNIVPVLLDIYCKPHHKSKD